MIKRPYSYLAFDFPVCIFIFQTLSVFSDSHICLILRTLFKTVRDLATCKFCPLFFCLWYSYGQGFEKKKKEGKTEGGKIEKGRFTLDLSLFFILCYRYLNLSQQGRHHHQWRCKSFANGCLPSAQVDGPELQASDSIWLSYQTLWSNFKTRSIYEYIPNNSKSPKFSVLVETACVQASDCLSLLSSCCGLTQ